MRLSNERIHLLGQFIADSLLDNGFIIFLDKKKNKLVESITAAIIDEMMVEDRLETEVRTMMQQYSSEIDQGDLDYAKMFQMIKRKLIRERETVL